MHYPTGFGYDEEYFLQLGGEAPRVVNKRWYKMIEWHKVRARNEALDIRAYSLAALEILNPDLQAIALKMRGKEVVEEKQSQSIDCVPPLPVAPRKAVQPRRMFRPQFRSRWK